MPPDGPATLALFFVLAYALMWACFIPVAVAIPARSLLGGALLLLGAFAPAIAAVVLTALRAGGGAVRALVAPVFQARVAPRWYAFALGFIIAIRLIAVLLDRLVTGAWPGAVNAAALVMIPLAIGSSTPFQAGEEIGWRGFALPRLAGRLGLAGASLLLGVLWAVWHLPQFFIRDAGSYDQSFWVFGIQVIPVSVALAFLWIRSGRSLLLPMLMHSAINNTRGFGPAPPAGPGVFAFSATPQAWLVTALLWAAAIGLLIWMVRTEPRRRGTYVAG